MRATPYSRVVQLAAIARRKATLHLSMLLPLLVLSYLVQFVHGTFTDATTSTCPPPDDTNRSVWSILGSCAITLLICVWHAIHFNISRAEWYWFLVLKALSALGSFFAPEIVVMAATDQWYDAHEKVLRFHEKGYEWSMTHSFFAEMGGFVYRDDQGASRTINSLEFLALCEENKIANPIITAKEIRALSKSDVLGKTILALQLIWFILQVVVRGAAGLAITLVELDTVCMAILSTLAILLWLNKPLCPECPHIFYSPQEVKQDPLMRETLSNAWCSEPSLLDELISYLGTRTITGDDETILVGASHNLQLPKPNGLMDKLVDKIDKDYFVMVSLCGTWNVLGGLHLIAWNFDFPSDLEGGVWRAASLILTACPLALLVGWCLSVKLVKWGVLMTTFTLGIVARAFLVGLMFASLRALPCTAFLTVAWTLYIPHF